MKKPLKRFTQCGSLTTFFIVFVIMFSLSSTALTTFGISKPNAYPPPSATPPPKGKECSSNQDCISFPDTSCVKDFDHVNRCLCGDYYAPRSGKCGDVLKGVRHRCNQDRDCEDNMLCKENNSTKGTFGSFERNTREKICLCNEELGYMENVIDKQCNAAVKNFMAGLAGYIAAIILYFTITQKFLTY